MMGRWSRAVWLGLGVLVLGASAAMAGPEPEAKGDSVALPDNRLVGQRMSNFTLKDAVTGKNVSLYGFRGKRAVVLAFLGTDCPLGNLYAPRLVEIARDFQDKGVVVLGVNSNAHETPEQVAAHAKEYGITFPVLKDEANLVADASLVERTCEVLVMDGMGMIRYRGAIDDQYGVGTRKPNVEHEYLREALNEVVSGGRVEIKATPVAGCLLDRVPPKPSIITAAGQVSRIRSAPPVIVEAREEADAKAEKAAGPVNYAENVASIFQNKCQNCHRAGEVGPFPLLTYDDARKHSAMIREVVDDRRMPPWHADPRYGHFQNDRSLSSQERATLLAWIDQGTPLGDPAKVPAAKTFPEGWTIGEPDVVIEVPEPYIVPAQGTVEYVHVRVPTKFKEDVWIQAAEARPGDRSVVHHIIVYVFPPGLNTMRGPFEGRADAHLCGYAPGDMPSIYPPGTAKKVPAGSTFLFQIHYTPTGTVKTDRSKVGLIFAKEPVKHRAHTLGIPQERFEIPPGAGSHPVAKSFTVRKDIRLLSFMPHMHLRGKDFKYDIEFPDGRRETMLSVPAFDFGWQSYYTLDEPLKLPKGSIIHCLAHFDNSSSNPYNPDPTKAVRWGEQTWEEMMIGYIDYIDEGSPDEEDAAAEPAPPARAGGLTGALKLLNNAAARRQAPVADKPKP